MKPKNITRIVVAVVLTLTVTLGSGAVGESIGILAMPVVYAGDCPSTGGGGGC